MTLGLMLIVSVAFAVGIAVGMWIDANWSRLR